MRMEQGRILVITGAPGTGKTTISSIIAKESDMEKSVHMLENQSPNLFGDSPLPLQYQVRSSQKIHDTLSEYPKFFLLCPFLPQKLLSR